MQQTEGEKRRKKNFAWKEQLRFEDEKKKRKKKEEEN